MTCGLPRDLSGLWWVPWPCGAQAWGSAQAVVHVADPATPGRAAGLEWCRGWTPFPSSAGSSGSFQLLLPVSPPPLDLALLPRHSGPSIPPPDRAGGWVVSPQRLVQGCQWQGTLGQACGIGPWAGGEWDMRAGARIAWW